MTLNITRAAHHLWRNVPVLGAEHIGKRLWDMGDGMLFFWGPCPDGWDEWECTRRFDKTKKQHLCAWVRERVCQFCGATGFSMLEALPITGTHGLYGLRCPKCLLIMECMTGTHV